MLREDFDWTLRQAQGPHHVGIVSAHIDETATPFPTSTTPKKGSQ